MGERCYLNKNVRLGSSGDAPLTLGNDVMIGPNVVMDTSRHNMERTDVPMKAQGLSHAPITVGDDVWIGANVVVVCGTTLGQQPDSFHRRREVRGNFTAIKCSI